MLLGVQFYRLTNGSTRFLPGIWFNSLYLEMHLLQCTLPLTLKAETMDFSLFQNTERSLRPTQPPVQRLQVVEPGRGVMTIQLYRTRRLRISGAKCFLPLYAFVVWTGINIIFYKYILPILLLLLLS